MNGLIAEIESNVRGCFAILSFREDWRRHFDMTTRGVARSFLGVVLALPAFVFTAFSVNHLVAENPTLVMAEATIPVAEIAMIWARFWLVFPIMAAIAVIALNTRHRYSSWLVTHNWMVFTLIHIQALLWAIYMAGLISASGLLSIMSFYLMARFLVHWRVAVVSLGLPFGLSIAAAGIPLAADLIVRGLLA